MSLKSRFSYPGTVVHDHVLPLSMLFPTVPLLPLTQTILSSTTLSPRRLTGRLSWRISICCAIVLATIKQRKHEKIIRGRGERGIVYGPNCVLKIVLSSELSFIFV